VRECFSAISINTSSLNTYYPSLSHCHESKKRTVNRSSRRACSKKIQATSFNQKCTSTVRNHRLGSLPALFQFQHLPSIPLEHQITVFFLTRPFSNFQSPHFFLQSRDPLDNYPSFPLGHGGKHLCLDANVAVFSVVLQQFRGDGGGFGDVST